MGTNNQEHLIADFVNRRLWAVVGASQDRNKYGNKVFRSLCHAGYKVYPVNPNIDEVEGTATYATLADLPELPEVVNLVVPPAVTEQVVKQAHELGLTRIWMQPGAESDEAIEFCETHEMQLVVDDCAMVRKRQWDEEPAEEGQWKSVKPRVFMCRCMGIACGRAATPVAEGDRGLRRRPRV